MRSPNICLRTLFLSDFSFMSESVCFLSSLITTIVASTYSSFESQYLHHPLQHYLEYLIGLSLRILAYSLLKYSFYLKIILEFNNI